MFIGHFAVGLAAKKFAPKSNLGLNFMACQLLDLIWPVLVLLGVETVHVEPGVTEFTPLNFSHYPYSHSLVMALLWSVLFGAGILLLRRDRKAGVVLGLVVLSHWVLDFLTHRPDLPLMLSGAKVGLGLWNSRLATVVIEGALFVGGITMYLRSTRLSTRRAKGIFWSLIAFLLIIYIANAFGPTPPTDAPAAAIAGPALAMWLIVAWGAYADAGQKVGRKRGKNS